MPTLDYKQSKELEKFLRKNMKMIKKEGIARVVVAREATKELGVPVNDYQVARICSQAIPGLAEWPGSMAKARRKTQKKQNGKETVEEKGLMDTIHAQRQKIYDLRKDFGFLRRDHQEEVTKNQKARALLLEMCALVNHKVPEGMLEAPSDETPAPPLAIIPPSG